MRLKERLLAIESSLRNNSGSINTSERLKNLPQSTLRFESSLAITFKVCYTCEELWEVKKKSYLNIFLVAFRYYTN